MRTTLNFNDELGQRAKEHAAKHGMTLTQLLETALLAYVERTESGTAQPYAYSPTIKGGKRLPTIDISDREALYDMLDESEP